MSFLKKIFQPRSVKPAPVVVPFEPIQSENPITKPVDEQQINEVECEFVSTIKTSKVPKHIGEVNDTAIDQGVPYFAFPSRVNDYAGCPFEWDMLTSGQTSIVTLLDPNDFIQVDFERLIYLEKITIKPPTVKGFNEKRLNGGYLLYKPDMSDNWVTLFQIQGTTTQHPTVFNVHKHCKSIQFLRGSEIGSGCCIGLGMLVCHGSTILKFDRLVTEKRGVDVGFNFA